MTIDEHRPSGAIVWVREHRAQAARRVCELAGLQIVAAGSPDDGRSAAVAGTLDAARRDDLRATIAGAEPGLVLLFDPGDFGSTGDHDAAAVHQAAQRGVRTVTLEPLPAGVNEASGGGWLAGRAPARPLDLIAGLPRADHAPGFGEAAELLGQLGDVRGAAITCGGAAEHGSAGAHLLTALAILHARLGVPEYIDAAFVPGVRGRQDLSRLRDLDGTFHAVARFSDGRAATLTASSRWATWTQRAELTLADGRVSWETGGFSWHSPDGQPRDEHRSSSRPDWCQAVAEGVRRLLDPTAGAMPPTGLPALLAVADAALHSARSGQPESPSTGLRVLEP